MSPVTIAEETIIVEIVHGRGQARRAMFATRQTTWHDAARRRAVISSRARAVPRPAAARETRRDRGGGPNSGPRKRARNQDETYWFGW